MNRIAELRAYKNGHPITLIKQAITKAFTLEQFQNARIRYIENLKHNYDYSRFETILR